ncbi:hypothetical protein T484DRAFT_1947293 [Baffinella frigidus]|nr:hypothetical protein T484DRAFT_1947293 [Cryptophyta sp. CCMP2293]
MALSLSLFSPARMTMAHTFIGMEHTRHPITPRESTYLRGSLLACSAASPSSVIASRKFGLGACMHRCVPVLPRHLHIQTRCFPLKNSRKGSVHSVNGAVPTITCGPPYIRSVPLQ